MKCNETSNRNNLKRCNTTHSFLAGRGLKLHKIPETRWARSSSSFQHPSTSFAINSSSDAMPCSAAREQLLHPHQEDMPIDGFRQIFRSARAHLQALQAHMCTRTSGEAPASRAPTVTTKWHHSKTCSQRPNISKLSLYMLPKCCLSVPFKTLKVEQLHFTLAIYVKPNNSSGQDYPLVIKRGNREIMGNPYTMEVFSSENHPYNII